MLHAAGRRLAGNNQLRPRRHEERRGALCTRLAIRLGRDEACAGERAGARAGGRWCSSAPGPREPSEPGEPGRDARSLSSGMLLKAHLCAAYRTRAAAITASAASGMLLLLLLLLSLLLLLLPMSPTPTTTAAGGRNAGDRLPAHARVWPPHQRRRRRRCCVDGDRDDAAWRC